MDPELLDFLLESIDKCDSSGLAKLSDRIKAREMALPLESVSRTQARIYNWLVADAKHFHIEKRSHTTNYQTKHHLLEALAKLEEFVRQNQLSRQAQRRLVREMVRFVRNNWTNENVPINDTILFQSLRSPDALVETMLPGYADMGALNWALADDSAP